MMQEASKHRCNKIKFISLSFVSKLNSERVVKIFTKTISRLRLGDCRLLNGFIIIIIIIIVFIRVSYINHILQRTYTHNIYLQTHTHIYRP